MADIMKNMKKAEIVKLKEQVSYQEGQIISKTLVQNQAVSMTIFSFDKNEEISTHESEGDALVTCLDGKGKITIAGTDYELLGGIHRNACKTSSCSICAGTIQNVVGGSVLEDK